MWLYIEETSLLVPVSQWSDVEAAVDSLNNTTITHLLFGLRHESADEDSIAWYRWFELVGGQDQRVLTYFFDPEDEESFSYILVDPAQTQPVTVYHGGLHETWNWQTPQMVVSKALVKRVLRYFYEHQARLTQGADWTPA